MLHMKRAKRSPLSHILVFGGSVLLLIMVIASSILLFFPQPDQYAPNAVFVFCMLLNFFVIYAGYLVYSMAKGFYKKNALFLMALTLISIPLDTISWLFFDMRMHELQYLEQVFWVITAIFTVSFAINTYHLLKKIRWPDRKTLAIWSLFGIAISVIAFFVSIILSVVAIIMLGIEVSQSSTAYLDHPLFIAIALFSMVFMLLFPLSIITLIGVGISKLIK